jgi:hypothetical protein
MQSDYQKSYYQQNKQRKSEQKKAKYWKDRKPFSEIPKKCFRCGGEYLSPAKIQKYCNECRRIVDNEIARKARQGKEKRYSKKCVVCGVDFLSNQPKQVACPQHVPTYRKIRNQRRAKVRLKSDRQFAIAVLTRNRVNELLKYHGVYKDRKSIELVGCTIQELCDHLEKQFTDGMSWSNRGVKGWHIDHKRPCSSFDLTDQKQLLECFHYTNLQPLWAVDNLKKSNHWLGPLLLPEPPA